MTRTHSVKLALTLYLLVGLTGCYGMKDARTTYRDKLIQLEPGETTLTQFHDIFPEAVLAGQNASSETRIDAYELRHTYWANDGWGPTREDLLWFYFFDQKLIKWGAPQDWPVPADLVIEKRLR